MNKLITDSNGRFINDKNKCGFLLKILRVNRLTTG